MDHTSMRALGSRPPQRPQHLGGVRSGRQLLTVVRRTPYTDCTLPATKCRPSMRYPVRLNDAPSPASGNAGLSAPHHLGG